MNQPTSRQAQFLAFIRDYMKLNQRAPSEAEMQRFFKLTPPSVHQMVVMLETRGFISRKPGIARSIELLPTPSQSQEDEPATKTSKTESILGHWRITQMDERDQDFVDAEVSGFVRIDDGGKGEFQFGYVHGWIDHEPTVRDGRPAAEWSWNGNDEMDETHGRGWATLQTDGTIKGRLSFHQGDKSGFVAVKQVEPNPGRPKKSR